MLLIECPYCGLNALWIERLEKWILLRSCLRTVNWVSMLCIEFLYTYIVVDRMLYELTSFWVEFFWGVSHILWIEFSYCGSKFSGGNWIILGFWRISTYIYIYIPRRCELNFFFWTWVLGKMNSLMILCMHVLYVCMYYTYIYLFTYVYLYVDINKYIHMYIHIYTSTYMYMYIYTCMYIWVYQCKYMYIYIFICIYRYTYIRIYICTFIYMYIYTYIYIHIHMYTHIYTCVNIHTFVYVYTCMYTYIYIYICIQ